MLKESSTQADFSPQFHPLQYPIHNFKKSEPEIKEYNIFDSSIENWSFYWASKSN